MHPIPHRSEYKPLLVSRPVDGVRIHVLMHINTNNQLSTQRPFHVGPAVKKTILILDDFPLTSFIEENKQPLIRLALPGERSSILGNRKKEAETRRTLHDSRHLLRWNVFLPYFVVKKTDLVGNPKLVGERF